MKMVMKLTRLCDTDAAEVDTTRCVRCGNMFSDATNGEDSCQYHPGPSQTGLRVQNAYDRVVSAAPKPFEALR